MPQNYLFKCIKRGILPLPKKKIKKNLTQEVAKAKSRINFAVTKPFV